MSRRWIRHLAGFFAGAIIVAALVSMQVLYSEKDLLASLSANAALAVAALIAIAFVRVETRPDRLSFGTMTLFIGYIVVRAVTSPAGYFARADLYSALGCFLLYIVVITFLSSAWRRIAVLLALIAFGVMHTAASAIQAGWGENYALLFPFLAELEHSGRGAGFYINPDHLAGLLEVLGIVGLSITCWSRWPKWSKVIAGYLTAVCYLGLAQTGSRGGYLSACASLILFAALSLVALRRGGSRLLLKFGGGGLLVLAAAVACIWFFIQHHRPLTQAVSNIFTPDQGRFDLWSAAVSQWHLRPWIGTGSGTYLFYGREFRTERMQMDPVDVHNDYLHLLCEYGIIGAALFVLCFGAHVRNGYRSFVRLGPRRIAAGALPLSDRLALDLGALCAVAAYVVHSAVDFNMHIPANALLIAFVVGILANPGIDPLSAHDSRRVQLLPKLAVAALAVVVLLQAVRLLPGEHDAEAARQALRDEEPARALAFAEEALAHESANPNIFFYEGRALGALADNEPENARRVALYERALDAFQRAYHLVPLDETYAIDLAFVYDQLGRFEEGEKMYQLARARDPRSDAVAALYESHREAWSKAQGDAAAAPNE